MTRSTAHLSLAIAGIAAIAVVLLAAHAPQEKPRDAITLDTGDRGMTVTAFIAWVGINLDLKITYAPAARALAATPVNTVAFDRPFEIAKSDLLAFAMSVLRSYKLALVERTAGSVTYYLVEHLDQPTVLQTARRFVTEAELDAIKDRYVLVACFVSLKHVAVQMVQTQVQRMNPMATPYGAAIIPVPAANGFIVVDFAPGAHSLVKLIRAMDVETQPGVASPSIQSLEVQLTRLGQVIAELVAQIRKQAPPAK